MARAERTGSPADPEALGLQLAGDLRAQGADEILSALGS
jgi:hydroxymethylbilane synthase